MSSGPPRKPPGAPPPAARPPPMDGVRGVGSVMGGPRGPPGPPPGAAPMAQLKPPPMAPPRGPGGTNRPPVEKIKTIDIHKKVDPSARPNIPGALGPRGPPGPRGGPAPRALSAEMEMESLPEPDDMGIGGMPLMGKAAPKFSAAQKPQAIPKKAGAIAMFKPQEEKALEPADKKPRIGEAAPMGKAPRPLPPRAQPPGIPPGQPMPPGQAPDKEKKAPPPVKPAPNRNRAPPRPEDLIKVDKNGRPKEKIVAPLPPGDAPPFIRGLKKKEEEEIILPRRQRPNPEFESSSEEEDEPDVKVAPKDPFAHIIAKEKEENDFANAPLPLPVEDVRKEAFGPPTDTKDAKKALEDKVKEKEKEQQNPPVKLVQEAAADDDDDFEEYDPDATAQQLGTMQASMAETFDTRDTASVAGSDAGQAVGLPPSSHIADNLKSSYVPPPPTEFEPVNMDSTLARDLTSGRFSVRCMEGTDIRRKDDLSANPRTDPFIKFKLGAAERFPWQSTGIKRKQDQHPNFDGEVVAFNLTNPAQYVMLDDVQLTVEVWNKSAFKDELMGAVTMSIVRILKAPFVLFKENVPLFLPGSKTSNSKLQLEFVFEEARPGMFVITLFEAHGLRNLDPMGQQHPYVNFSVGPSYSKKSNVVKNGAMDPYFQEQEILIWADSENWVNDLKFDVCDEIVGMDKPIGSSYLSMLPYMNQLPQDARTEEYDLFYYIQLDPKDDREKREVACGVLIMRVMFLQAGKLNVHCTKGKNLNFPEGYQTKGDNRMDPYCSLTLDGQAVKMVKRTPADKDGGHDPVFEHDVKFDLVDQYLLDLDVYHQNMQGMDVLLGYTQISLLPIFRNGKSEFWVTLKQQKLSGGIIEVGAIHLIITFEGMTGLHFPQHRPGVDTFDDTVRKAIGPAEEQEEEDRIEVKPEISTIPGVDPESPVKDPSKTGTGNKDGDEEEEPAEFSEEEIVAAFKFIDLDHNNFVGAAEIRHILICMGEMITDEEIDCMIAMVDVDGDGQVSFQEFRTLIMHPNPAEANLTKEIGLIEEKESNLEKQALAGKHVGLDLTAFQRQKEMLGREARKKLLIGFVGDNEVDFDFIKHAYSRYLSMPREQRKNGRITFEQFCQVVDVEPISEYKQIHTLFDTEERGDMDFREFCLSLMNFVEVEREIRVRFSFQMFDELKTGFISIAEVEEILRGNHMISLASVSRKAQTIMKQASTNSSGHITCNEFVVVSKKFPNILLPVFHASNMKNR